MSLRDCISSALDRGAISAEEAAYLRAAADRYDGVEKGPAEIKSMFAEHVRAEAAEQARVEGLTRDAQLTIHSDLRRFAFLNGMKPDLAKAAYALFENFGSGYQSYRSIRSALLSQALTEMNDFMHEFRRNFALKRMNRPLMDDVIRALHGENVSEPAKALAKSWSNVAEKLRGQFNAAGGHIATLEDWAVPQRHDASALLNAGFDRWRQFIEPRLDWDRIVKPISGASVDISEREATLRAVYNAIVSDGWNKREPGLTPTGRGALYNQRDDARFLHFKDANSWLEYARSYGQGSPFSALVDHVNGLTRDVAMMRRFGPNPAAMVEWLKQVVSSEGAKFKLGEPSLLNAGSAATADFTARKTQLMLDGFMDAARGSPMPFSKTGAAIEMMRNLQYGAKLGSAVLVHVTSNPIIQLMGRHLQGHSMLGILPDIAKSFSRNEADRAGMILEDALAHLEGGAREQAAWMKTRETSRWLPAVTSRWSGLDAVASASKRSAFMGQMATYGRLAGHDFEHLPARIRDGLQGFGIDSEAWDKIRGSSLYDPDSASPLLRPQDVKDNEAQLAYRGLLHGQAEAMVPQSNLHVQAATAFANRSPLGREIVKSMLQFKSGFMATFMLTQMQQIQRELTRNGTAAVGAYLASTVILLTLGGMTTLQMKQLATGKDFLPMNPLTPEGALTWARAFLSSGSLGIYGDFLSSEMSSYGHSFLETLAGPTVTGASDLISGAVEAGKRVTAWGTGVKPPPGSEEGDLLKTLRNNTPVLSTHWALRAAFNRVILDQLQYMSDPNAHRAMRATEQRIKRDTGQGFWWRPGALVPERAPGFTSGR